MRCYKINAANILTLFRMIMVPFFVFFIKFDNNQIFRIAALLIFIIASLTDAIDGIVARKFNLISNFGKFLDPLADKILVTAAMIIFVELKLMNSTYLIIIIFREFLVTSLRLCAALNGEVISANFWGKLKTVLQIFAILIILFNHAFFLENRLKPFSNFVMFLAVIVTIISGLFYLIQNFKYIAF